MNKKAKWNSGRLRGLSEAKTRIGNLEKEIKNLLKKKKKIKVLEIGCGYGRALIELKKIFGNKIEIYGINLEKTWNLNLVKKYALTNNLCSIEEFTSLAPKIYILDAGKKMKFKSKSFDFIFSQASVQYIQDKALFLEEINRILTDKGLALIELQEFKGDYPKEYKDLIEIWKGDKKISVIDYLSKFNNLTLKKSSKGWQWHIIKMKKSSKFKLGLRYITSFDLNKINKSWWGSKVIYKLR